VVPKIDWFDNSDEPPRWEPRPRRERLGREPRDRRARLEQIMAMAALPPPSSADLPVKPPLHLIWGRPVRRPAGDAESDRG
jgi:hypothetical protein